MNSHEAYIVHSNTVSVKDCSNTFRLKCLKFVGQIRSTPNNKQHKVLQKYSQNSKVFDDRHLDLNSTSVEL